MSDELEFVLQQLADHTRPIHTVNLAQLSDVPRSQTDLFRQAWANFGPERRLEIISAMVEQSETNIQLNFHALLRECLYDPDARVRRLAVEGLWEDERTSLVAPLIRLLSEDPAAEVRAAAAISLGRFVLLGALGEISEAVAARVEEALRASWFRPREVNEVRRRALEGLAYLGGPLIADLIGSAYYDEDDLMRQSAVFAMGRTAEKKWAKFVLAELGSHNAAMRFEAAGAAGELGLTAAVKPLIGLLEDPDSNVREAAAMALGKVGGMAARRALEACIQGDDERLAEAAEEALAELRFNSETPEDLLMDYGKAPGLRSPAGHGQTWDEENDHQFPEDEEDDLLEEWDAEDEADDDQWGDEEDWDDGEEEWDDEEDWDDDAGSGRSGKQR